MKIRNESGHIQEAQYLFSPPQQTSAGRLWFVVSESEMPWEDAGLLVWAAEESGLGRWLLFAFRPFPLTHPLPAGCTATPWLGAGRVPSPDLDRLTEGARLQG